MNSDSITPNLTAESAMACAKGNEIRHLEEMARQGNVSLEEMAAQFESIFLNMVIKQMWDSVEKSELLPEGPGRKIYDGMITSTLADHLTRSGGIGIAKSMVSQLKNAVQAYEIQQESQNKGESPEPVQSERIIVEDNGSPHQE